MCKDIDFQTEFIYLFIFFEWKAILYTFYSVIYYILRCDQKLPLGLNNHCKQIISSEILSFCLLIFSGRH